MNVSAASLAPDSSVCKATPSDITERTACSGAVVETTFLSRPRRAQCNKPCEDLTVGKLVRNHPHKPGSQNSFRSHVLEALACQDMKIGAL